MESKVGELSKKVQESRLNWYGYIMRREDGDECAGKRSKGRPKWRSMDSIKHDLSEKRLSGKDANNLTHLKVGKDAVDEDGRLMLIWKHTVCHVYLAPLAE